MMLGLFGPTGVQRRAVARADYADQLLTVIQSSPDLAAMDTTDAVAVAMHELPAPYVPQPSVDEMAWEVDAARLRWMTVMTGRGDA